MAHYAVIDKNNVVIFVHPGKDEGKDGIDWEKYYGAVRTSYNTLGNKHPNGTPFRYNFASIGYTFDPNFGVDGAFIPPKPYESWNLDLNTALWQPPIPIPETGGAWYWDEPTLSWIEVPLS